MTPFGFVCGFVGNRSSGVVVTIRSVVNSSLLFSVILKVFLVVREAVVVRGVKGRGFSVKKCLLVVAGVEFGSVNGPSVVVSSVKTSLPPKNSKILDLYS